MPLSSLVETLRMMSPDGWFRRWSHGTTSAEEVVDRWRTAACAMTPWLPHEPFRSAVTAADPESEPRAAIADALLTGGLTVARVGPIAFVDAADGTLGTAFDHEAVTVLPVAVSGAACDAAGRRAIVDGWSRRAIRHRADDGRVRDATALLGIVAGLDPSLSDGDELLLIWPSRSWDRRSDARFGDGSIERLPADAELGRLARQVMRWGGMSGSKWSGFPEPFLQPVTSTIEVRCTSSAIARAEQRRRVMDVIAGGGSVEEG